MTPPDEIVCDSVESFKKALRGVPWLVLLADPRPGDSVSVNGTDIIYRPKPPALSRPLCPRCGKAMTRVSVALNIEAWECENDGRFHKYDGDPPPPPRDEAEDAFRKWAMSGGAYALDRITFTDPDMDRQYRAFLAGRASVKP